MQAGDPHHIFLHHLQIAINIALSVDEFASITIQGHLRFIAIPGGPPPPSSYPPKNTTITYQNAKRARQE